MKIVLAALTFAALAAAVSADAAPLSRATVGDIRAHIAAFMAAHRVPGGTWAIGLDGKVAWTEGFGLADVENGVRADANTKYRTASIGKSMTATAAMALAEQGKLELDAPIQKYCPRFPVKPWPISARDLISHTSGIRHYEGPNLQAELFNTRHYDRVADALDIFKDDPLKQQPGDDFLYTTWGYVTLGCVLEGASGEEYRALMRRMIFAPAGMADTREDEPAAIIAHRARGYILVDGALQNSRAVDMSSKLPAGGWITTAADLVRFMNASMEGKFVSRETMTQMLTPYRLPRGKGTVDNFGLGWFVDEYHGMKAGLYGGGTPQVAGVVFFVPEKRLAIAGLFNLENPTGAERIALAETLADIVLGLSTRNPDHVTPPQQ